MSRFDVVNIILATESMLIELIQFLQQPKIDHAFIRPLSERDVSIRDRVYRIYQSGFWLVALCNGKVIGCRGCKGIIDKQYGILEFSTTVVDSVFRGVGLATLLFQQGVKIAYTRYRPSVMKLDSWSTNKAVERIVLKLGFSKNRVYDDSEKRLPGMQSVEYILDCTKIHRYFCIA